MMACATDIYSSNYTTVQGQLLTSPIIEPKTKRVIFYLTDDEGQVQIAIAENHENFQLLRSLANNMGNNKATIYLFCIEADNNWREYVDSVDYVVYGIGYYDYFANRYITVITTYGDNFTDVLRSTDWKTFILDVGKKALKAL